MSIGTALPGTAPLVRGLRGLKGLSDALNFGETLKQKLDTATSGSDALAQIAALVQNGTPMATVVDRISQQLADSAARALGKPLDTDVRTQLRRAFANALAPPGTSPPAASSEQASALGERLRTLLGTLAREAENAGQQNRFSGKILDADSARELPAPQTKSTAGDITTAQIASFARSLLSNAAASLQASLPASLPSTPATLTQQAPVLQALAQAVHPVPQQSVAPAVPLPDIIGRMLARAARADAQLNGATPLASAASATTATGAHATTATPSPSALFERLLATIANANAGGNDAQSDADPHASTANRTLPAMPVNIASKDDGSHVFGAQLASTSTTAPADSTTQSVATPYTPVDAQAVIEQVVKGIVMRNSGSSSEVRMRLSPDHLGDVSLKLTVDGGTINATMVAQNADVRDMLLTNQHQLARSLAEAGLSLGSFSVDVSGNQTGGSGQQQQQTFANHHGRLGHAIDSSETGEQWLEPRFGPTLVPSSQNPWLLNTLV
ncbi:MAG: flagellar hook-length control protein FliK [Vulcanimicrobiaceae bacterium]